jgi:hypothetical protein
MNFILGPNAALPPLARLIAANVVWCESQMHVPVLKFLRKIARLALDELGYVRNRNHALQWGSPGSNSAAYTSSVRVPKFALLHVKSAL